MIDILKRGENKLSKLPGSKDLLKLSPIKIAKLKTKKPIVSGLPASIGLTPFITARVKVVKSAKEASERIQEGDILVTERTDPDFVSFMRIASAIITEKGGVASHAAIVSRELRIPCIVGVEGAMKKLKDGQVYFLDTRRGTLIEV